MMGTVASLWEISHATSLFPWRVGPANVSYFQLAILNFRLCFSLAIPVFFYTAVSYDIIKSMELELASLSTCLSTFGGRYRAWFFILQSSFSLKLSLC